MRQCRNGVLRLYDRQDAGGWASIQVVADTYGPLEKQAVHETILAKASAIATLLSDTKLRLSRRCSLTHR